MGSAARQANNDRYCELMKNGIDANTPEMLLTMALADSEANSAWPILLGWAKEGEDNINAPELHEEYYSREQFHYTKYTAKAFEMVTDLLWLK